MPFVRQATPGDLGALRSFDEWKVVTEERITAGDCFVAGLQDRVLAYGILDRSFCQRQFIAILFVHPEHRHRGLGSALIGHFESLTTDEKLWVSTNIENRNMQGALHKNGYATYRGRGKFRSASDGKK